MSPTIARLVVDGHAHLHACYPASEFLRYASGNAADLAREVGWTGATACVVLTEGAAEHGFDTLHSRAGQFVDGWLIERTQEATSLVASAPPDRRLFVIAGTQVVCAERLEVLALGARIRDLDGLPLAAVLDVIRAAGAVPVVPWGVGKWLGERGELVRTTLAAASPGSLFLGDNGGRWSGLGTPREFALADRRGIATLPGTDPLPLAHEVRRVGSYGFMLEGPFEPEFPARSVLDLILRLARSPRVGGRRVGLRSFVRNQVALRLRGPNTV